MDTDPHQPDAHNQEETIPDHLFRELHIEFLIHELKDPLAVTEAGVRSLLEKSDKFGHLSLRQEQVLRRVLRGTLKSRSMVNMLLEIGRSEAGQLVLLPFLAGKTIYASLLDALETMHSDLFAEVSEQPTEHQALAVLAQAGIVVHNAPETDDIELIQLALASRLAWFRRIITPSVGGVIVMLIVVTVFPIGTDLLTKVPPHAQGVPAAVTAGVTFGVILFLAVFGGNHWRL